MDGTLLIYTFYIFSSRLFCHILSRCFCIIVSGVYASFFVGFALTEEELLELARKSIVKDHLELVVLPADGTIQTGDTVTLRTVSALPKFNKERVVVTIGRGLYDKTLEEALAGKKAGDSCEVTVKDQPVSATVLEIKRKTVPSPTDEMVRALGAKDFMN